MIWRALDTVVLGLGSAFWVIDGTGAITTYEPNDWTNEDDLGHTTYEMRGAQLVERNVVEHWGYDAPDDERETVLIDGLQPDDSDETRHFVDVALGDRRVVAEETRIREEAEANARLAAIEGALDRFELGEDFERAQQTLVTRVRDRADEAHAALLRTLIDLGRANPSPVVLGAYVRGCLLACFAGRAPDLVEDAEVTPSPLAETIAAHAEMLQRLGDQQYEYDAPLNGREYLAAAEALRACARMLHR